MVSPAPSTERRPEAVDALTGLATRHGFARAVDQADRDRDRMVVAVVAIDGLAEVNRFSGHHAGDDLLRALGRPLAQRASVDVTPARIGGSAFGLLLAPADDHRPREVLDPIVADLDRTIADWLAQRAALGTPSPVRPSPVIGVAAGHGGGVWGEAELALEAALGDPSGPAITEFQPDEPGLADHRRRHRLVGELAEAIDRDALPLAGGVVEPLVADPAPAGRWVRLGLHLPNAGRAGDDIAPGGISATELLAAPGLAGAIDRRLLDRATALLAGPAGAGDSGGAAPIGRVTVAPLGPLVGRRALVDGADGRPPGIMVEIAQSRLAALAGPATDELARRLHELGWDLTIADFDGGLEGWRLRERLDARHLLVDDGLVGAGDRPDGPRSRLMTATAASAAAEGCRLLARHGLRPDEELAVLGVELVARPLTA